jgi:hypothetical protein
MPVFCLSILEAQFWKAALTSFAWLALLWLEPPNMAQHHSLLHTDLGESFHTGKVACCGP